MVSVKPVKCPNCGKKLTKIEEKIWGGGAWTFELDRKGSSKFKDWDIDNETDHSYYCPKCNGELDGPFVLKFTGEK